VWQTYAALAVVSALLVAYAGWRRSHRIAALRRVPAAKLATAEPGTRVRITGATAPVGELTTAPFSGRPCLAALGERWELGPRGDPVHCVDRQARAATFTIDDGSAVARVIADPVRCELTTQPTKITTSGAGRPFGAGVLAANMERMGAGQQIREGLVTDGARITVVATVRRTDAGELELVGSAAEPVTITDAL
jgi:hypothetical protein